MSTVELHTVPDDVLIKNEESSLCVYDAAGRLMADYDFCTGLRLLKTDEGMTVYVNDGDLVPGSWVLRLMTMSDDRETTTLTRIEGTKAGTPTKRVIKAEYPWANCGNGARIANVERRRRLAVCMSCEFLNHVTMSCTQAPDFWVLDETTRADSFCPKDLWRNRQAVVDAKASKAIADGLVDPAAGPTITAEDQAQFEAELDAFFGGTA